jgi:hypothetical protein
MAMHQADRDKCKIQSSFEEDMTHQALGGDRRKLPSGSVKFFDADREARAAPWAAGDEIPAPPAASAGGMASARKS